MTQGVDTLRAVDGAALDRARRRQMQATQPPWLHGEVAHRMAERLAVIKRTPDTLIDWDAAPGASGSLLRTAYPKARVVRVGSAGGVVPRRSSWLTAMLRREPAPIAPQAVLPASAQLVWANMVLHGAADPGALIGQWRRALTVDGFLMFSTVGPDTLKTLGEIYRAAGWGSAYAPFVDMHDLGDMLVAAGFADPVMDQEMLRLTWSSPAALLTELRQLGINADPARFGGLRTPRWRTRLEAALSERADTQGRIALEFEIVYGHAFNAPPRVRVAGETRLSPQDLQRMARKGRRNESLG